MNEAALTQTDCAKLDSLGDSCALVTMQQL